MAADNKLLGQFDLMGLPPAPRGVPQVEVTFDIDANGIVSVTAKDKATNKEQQIRIQASGGLSDADIKKMVQEAEGHAAEDKANRALAEAKNQADSLIHSTEKAVSEHGAKVGEAEKHAIEEAIAALKEAVKTDDVEDIKAKTNTLAQASMKLGEAMYKAQAAASGEAGAPGAEPDAEKKDDNVVDAEFSEVDENKKNS
jgi:molecular chaperone DnaK